VVALTNKIYGGTYNPCERGGYTFMVVLEYSIIFPKMTKLKY